jgi:hypothetical protein
MHRWLYWAIGALIMACNATEEPTQSRDSIGKKTAALAPAPTTFREYDSVRGIPGDHVRRSLCSLLGDPGVTFGVYRVVSLRATQIAPDTESHRG